MCKVLSKYKEKNKAFKLWQGKTIAGITEEKQEISYMVDFSLLNENPDNFLKVFKCMHIHTVKFKGSWS